MSTPLSDAERTRILDLHAQGHSRNAIARETGRAAGTVTTVLRAAGRSTDRSATKQATEARQVDLAASRVELAQKMMQRAHKIVDDLDNPYTVYNFGGKDNSYNEHTFKTPPIEVQRNALTTAGIAFDKATRIVEAPKDAADLDAVKAALVDFAAQLHDEGDDDGDALPEAETEPPGS
ncbi:MAG: helix-turn-helix domain-containing protein [Pseudoclavibacter sp.]